MPSVLIVDDNIDLAHLAEDFLSTHGLTATCAESGDEALSLLRNDLVPDLLFSDIVMPGLSGYTLAKLVRIEFPGVRILLTTGWKLPEQDEFDILLKPYKLEELAKRAKEALRT